MIERYTLRDRLVHALAGMSYLYLLLTGLAFWTPALYWLAIVLGGGYLSRLLHPWAGLIFAGAVVWMGVSWFRDMRVTDDDRRWRRAMRSYVRNEDADVPGAGRFNYGQKMLFWVMAGGGVVLLGSGLVMWFVASIPSDMLVVRSAATLVHAIAALVTIGAFIVHVYMGIAVVPGGVSAIVRGTVSEEWARHHHPLWTPRASTMSRAGGRRDR
jgi:formate dehydrogenase subunit gamma